MIRIPTVRRLMRSGIAEEIRRRSGSMHFSFRMCRKYDVRWASATPKEQAFIEEVTRVTYERDRAQRLGTPLSEIRPSFAS